MCYGLDYYFYKNILLLIIKMNRIDVLNVNQLAKELQGYNKYQSKTQKEIKQKIGNTTLLRKELARLESKKNEIKTYSIGGDTYTEDELITMIKFYKTHHSPPITTLPYDVVKIILYDSDINTIVQYCSTEKYNSICNSNEFWKHIFTRDKIKILSYPTNYQDWIDMYKNVLEAQKEAFILETLPREITGGVYDFKINNHFDLHFKMYADFLSNVDTFYTNISQKGVSLRSVGHKDKIISKTEFNNLLTDILYFYPDVYITSPGDKDVPLRKRDISKLRSKQGFKSIANKILSHYK